MEKCDVDAFSFEHLKTSKLLTADDTDVPKYPLVKHSINVVL